MGNLIILLFIFFIVIPKLQQKRAQQQRMMRDDAARRAEAAVRAAQNAAQSAAAAQRAAEQNAAAVRNAQQNAAAARRAQNAASYPPPTRAPKYQQNGSGNQSESFWDRLKGLKGEQDAQTLSFKKTFGLIGAAVGGGIASLFGLVTIFSTADFIESLVYGFFFAEDLTMSIILALLTVGGIALARFGAGVYRRAKNFEWYRAIIGERRECPITDIARATGRNPQKVLRDLQDLVRNGYFPLGFADAETGCFYADNDAYRQSNPEKAKWEDAVVRGQTASPSTSEPAAQPEPEPRQTGPLSDAQLREYKRRMEQIQDTELHEKAARLYEHAEDIFAWVQLHPECTDDVRRFCNYYLPTANKLLATYNEIAPHKNDSRVAANIESEVSRVLDTMTTAFRGLMDNLLQNTAVDMQAEISALETVLAQEGLTQNGLTL